MSGGSMDYVSFRLKEQEGCFRGDSQDELLEELLKDFADLLHAREWYLSSDTCEGEWNEARDGFLEKLFGAIAQQLYCKDCKNWTAQDDSKYGRCIYHKTCLIHRSENICENFCKKIERNVDHE